MKYGDRSGFAIKTIQRSQPIQKCFPHQYYGNLMRIDTCAGGSCYSRTSQKQYPAKILADGRSQKILCHFDFSHPKDGEVFEWSLLSLFFTSWSTLGMIGRCPPLPCLPLPPLQKKLFFVLTTSLAPRERSILGEEFAN